MGWTEGKTRNLLYRGLADLRERLQRDGRGMGPRRGGIMSDERLRELYAAAVAGRPAGAGPHPAPEAIAALVAPRGLRGGAARHAGPRDGLRRLPARLRPAAHARTSRSPERCGGPARGAVEPGSCPPPWPRPSCSRWASVGRCSGSGTDDTTRGDGESGAIVLVQPGAEMPAGESLTFAWRPVPARAGTSSSCWMPGVRWRPRRRPATRPPPPDAAHTLPPGEYRWWVRATTSDARTLRSALRPLRLTAE